LVAATVGSAVARSVVVRGADVLETSDDCLDLGVWLLGYEVDVAGARERKPAGKGIEGDILHGKRDVSNWFLNVDSRVGEVGDMCGCLVEADTR